MTFRSERFNRQDHRLGEFVGYDACKATLLDRLLWMQANFPLDSDGYFYRSTRKLVEDCGRYWSHATIRRRLDELCDLECVEWFVPDDPTESRRYRIDVAKLAEMLGFAPPHFYEVTPPKSDDSDDVGHADTAPVSQRHTPVSDRHTPLCQPDTNRELKEKETRSLSQTRAREDSTSTLNEKQNNDRDGDFVEGMISEVADRFGYQLSNGQSLALAMALAEHFDDTIEMRSYLIQRLKECRVNDKPIGRALHYIGNLGDVKKWRSEASATHAPDAAAGEVIHPGADADTLRGAVSALESREDFGKFVGRGIYRKFTNQDRMPRELQDKLREMFQAGRPLDVLCSTLVEGLEGMNNEK